MTEPRLDLEALDPSHDKARWERMVRSVAARGAEAAARRRPGSLELQLAAWLRPALACAAAVALLVWVPAWLRPPQAARTPPVAAAADQAARLAAWASSDEATAASGLLLTFGDEDDAR
jgi:hypothetical protein